MGVYNRTASELHGWTPASTSHLLYFYYNTQRQACIITTHNPILLPRTSKVLLLMDSSLTVLGPLSPNTDSSSLLFSWAERDQMTYIFQRTMTTTLKPNYKAINSLNECGMCAVILFIQSALIPRKCLANKSFLGC